MKKYEAELFTSRMTPEFIAKLRKQLVTAKQTARFVEGRCVELDDGLGDTSKTDELIGCAAASLLGVIEILDLVLQAVPVEIVRV